MVLATGLFKRAAIVSVHPLSKRENDGTIAFKGLALKPDANACGFRQYNIFTSEEKAVEVMKFLDAGTYHVFNEDYYIHIKPQGFPGSDTMDIYDREIHPDAAVKCTMWENQAAELLKTAGKDDK